MQPSQLGPGTHQPLRQRLPHSPCPAHRSSSRSSSSSVATTNWAGHAHTLLLQKRFVTSLASRKIPYKVGPVLGVCDVVCRGRRKSP